MENSPNEESGLFALEGTSEHGLIEQQVQKLSGMSDPMSDAWVAELKVLEDLIDHHVDEEEDTGFGYARRFRDRGAGSDARRIPAAQAGADAERPRLEDC